MNPMHHKNKNRLNDQPTARRLRRSFALYAAIVAACCLAMPVLADGDPLTVINNLSTFIFSVIRAIGLILLGWGIVQIGQHQGDPLGPEGLGIQGGNRGVHALGNG